MVIFYSAGHNPSTPGATSGGIQEYYVCKDILEQIRLLSPASYFVPSLPLAEKIAWVNERCQPDDRAIEIHANIGFPSRKRAEGYYYGANVDLALDYAQRVASVMGNGAVALSDTLTAVGSLGWCRNLRCRSALIEIGYLSNAEERAKMTDANMQRKIAEAIVGEVVPQPSKFDAILAVLKAFLPEELFTKVKPYFV